MIELSRTAYDMRDPRSEMETSGLCAAAAVLRDDIEMARYHALDFAIARDGVPSLDEGGIRWVLRESPMAAHVTAKAKAAGEWALNNGLCTECRTSGHPDGFCSCTEDYCAHNWGIA